eukprot:TRINITY_DN628_c1_g1_i1.p1 TRINITY_DN628_c1_g1~~TRINITY_DN628_c1_g1_i1.p1  ORF type:complete len:662 (+),score=235.58 TRINITY_DN628_c1_g1_i1:22-2007(+)
MAARGFMLLLGLLCLLTLLATVAGAHIPRDLEDILIDEFDLEFGPDSVDTEEGEEYDENEYNSDQEDNDSSPEFDEIELNSKVTSLNHKIFDHELRKTKFAMIEFYAPWCPHCKSLVPEYDKVYESFKTDKEILIAKINADYGDNVEFAERYGVSGFPSLIFFSNYGKNWIKYEGKRASAPIVAFIKALSSNPVVEVKSEGDLDRLFQKINQGVIEGDDSEEDEDEDEEEDEEGHFDFEKREGLVKSDPNAFVSLQQQQLTAILGSFPDSKSPEYKAFVQAAFNTLGHNTFANVKDVQLKKKFGLKEDSASLVALRIRSGRKFQYTGSLTDANEIVQFAADHSQKISVDTREFDRVSRAHDPKPLIVYYYDKYSLADKYAKDSQFDVDRQLDLVKNALVAFSEEHLGKYRFSLVDVSRNKLFSAVLAVRGDNVPEGLVVLKRRHAERYHPAQQIPPIITSNVESQESNSNSIKKAVQKLIEDFEDGKLRSEIFSVPIGSPSPFAHHEHSEKVHHLVAADWDRFMTENSEDVIIFVFSQSCPYCHEFAPIFRRVASFWNSNTNSKNLPKVSFAEFNYINNDFVLHKYSPTIEIEEFPTFLFSPAKNFLIGENIYNRTHPYSMKTDTVGVDMIQEIYSLYNEDEVKHEHSDHTEIHNELSFIE